MAAPARERQKWVPDFIGYLCRASCGRFNRCVSRHTLVYGILCNNVRLVHAMRYIRSTYIYLQLCVRDLKLDAVLSEPLFEVKVGTVFYGAFLI